MNPTDKRKLGSSPLQVTQLGFGGVPLGDLYQEVGERAWADLREEGLLREDAAVTA